MFLAKYQNFVLESVNLSVFTDLIAKTAVLHFVGDDIGFVNKANI